MTFILPRNLTVGFLVLIALLAGCLQGDEPTPEDDGESDVSEAGLGTVRGTVITVNLEPVEGATVRLAEDSELLADSTTDADGDFMITDVEPGDYRLQVTSACCREAVRPVTVVADDIVSENIQLDIFSDDDLELPRVEPYEWTGFLACTLSFMNPDGPHQGENVGGVPLGVTGVNVCGLVEILAEDATGDDFLHTFEVKEGLRTIVGGMSWRAPGAALGDELSISMEVDGRPNLAPRFASAAGESPVEFRADAGYVEETYDEEVEGHDIHQYEFNNIESPLELMYRIFASGDANFVYQQQVTVYWDLYYWEEAPEDATALPDS